MLVLSRKLFESIQIADDITITVVRISGDKVRLAIDAPRKYTVHRSEVVDRIAAAALSTRYQDTNQNESSAEVVTDDTFNA